MPRLLYGKLVLTLAGTRTEYVKADENAGFVSLNINRKESVDYLIPCSKVKTHVDRLLPVAIKWHQDNNLRVDNLSAEIIYSNYVNNGLAREAALDYESLRIYAEEKGLAFVAYGLENQDEATLKVIQSYSPNRG